jgi:hypothetical protein
VFILLFRSSTVLIHLSAFYVRVSGQVQSYEIFIFLKEISPTKLVCQCAANDSYCYPEEEEKHKKGFFWMQ